jgi:hypothetical protein
MMVAQLLSRLSVDWVIAGIVLSAVSILVSVFALVRSSKAVRASIPDPEVQTVLVEFVVIRMRPADEHRFAISIIASRSGKFLVSSDVKLRDLPDILRGYAPLGRRIRSATFDPPATSLIIRTPQSGTKMRARIVSRLDPSISKWITIGI